MVALPRIIVKRWPGAGIDILVRIYQQRSPRNRMSGHKRPLDPQATTFLFVDARMFVVTLQVSPMMPPATSSAVDFSIARTGEHKITSEQPLH